MKVIEAKTSKIYDIFPPATLPHYYIVERGIISALAVKMVEEAEEEYPAALEDWLGEQGLLLPEDSSAVVAVTRAMEDISFWDGGSEGP